MQHPSELRPTSAHEFVLSDARIVLVAKATPSFSLWRGEPPGYTYGGKAILDVDGQPGFAELAILGAFLRDGWDGVWIDTYRAKLRRGYWGVPPVDRLPSPSHDLLDRIVKTRGGIRRGTWDVFCWRGNDVAFAESKRKRRDRLKPDQTHFLEAGLAQGVPLDSFLIVEWNVAPNF